MLTCFMVHACGHIYIKLVLNNICISFNTGYVEEGKGDRERQTEEREREREGDMASCMTQMRHSCTLYRCTIHVGMSMRVCPY